MSINFEKKTNTMVTIAAKEILKGGGPKTGYLGDMELAGIPAVNDKVIMDESGTGYVFKVIELHFADGGKVDVYLERISSITDYNISRF